MSDETPEAIVEYWIGPAARDPDAARARGKSLWYAGEADADIRERFGDTLKSIEFGRFLQWAENPEGALALVIVLDQFARNIHRGKAEAFAQDALARAIAVRSIDQGFDSNLSVAGRAFLYHPFEHSESVLDQDRSVELFARLVAEAEPQWQEFAQGFLGFAEGHRKVVRQFGRFPHRNAALGRANTPEEEMYLKRSSSYGQ